MSDLGNKKIFAKNLNYYMNINKKSRIDVCRDLEIPYSTFTDWCNANIYPRIDKIELLANYFEIQKSDLVERKDMNNSTISNEKYLEETVKKYGISSIELLDNFSKLNELGKQKANDNLKDLTKINEYTEKKTELKDGNA